MKKCYTCGRQDSFKESIVTDLVEVGERSFKVQVKASVCECGEHYTHIDDLGEADMSVAAWLADNGATDAASFRFMRKAIGLKAVDLAKLLDVDVATVSRWENGHIPVDQQAAFLLGSMTLDRVQGLTITVDRLTRMHERREVSGPISIRPHPLAHVG